MIGTFAMYTITLLQLNVGESCDDRYTFIQLTCYLPERRLLTSTVSTCV